MGGIDTPREREKIEYRPRLRYELPPAVEAEISFSDPVTLVRQVERFSVSAAIGEAEALLESVPPPPGGDDLLLEVRGSLAVVRYLLESQRRWIPDEEEAKQRWLSLLAAAEDAKRKLQEAAEAVPWIALTYPEEHPEYEQQAREYFLAERAYSQAFLAASDATRLHFTVADVVHVARRHVDGLKLLVQRFREPPKSPAVKFAAAAPLVARRTAQLDRDLEKLKVSLELVGAAGQKAAADRLLELEALRLEAAAAVRNVLWEQEEGEDPAFDEVAEELAAAVAGVEEEYRAALFDMHRVFELFRENVQGQLDILKRRSFLRGIVP